MNSILRKARPDEPGRPRITQLLLGADIPTPPLRLTEGFHMSYPSIED